MPMDGILLSHVVRELSETLLEGRVDRIIQPERDEIQLLVRAGGQNHRLLISAAAHAARIHLSQSAKQSPQEPPMFCMLLRKHLGGARVHRIRQIAGDRIVFLDFSAQNELGDPVMRHIVLEIMGRHSNIMLLDQNECILDAARRVGEDVSRVRQVLPGLPYRLPPMQDKLPPQQADLESIHQRLCAEHGALDKAIGRNFAGFSPQAAEEAVCRLGFAPGCSADAADPEALAQGLFDYFTALPTLGPAVVTLSEDGEPRDVYPFQQRHLNLPIQTYESPSAALDAFFDERDRRAHMAQRSSSLSHLIRASIERAEKKIALQEEALRGAARMDEYRRNGELLQASLYHLQRGQALAEVQDYYQEDCPTVSIPMDVTLSPAQNAQRYFKLYRKARGARLLAAEQKAKAEAELLFFLQLEDDLRKATSESDLSALRQLLEDEGYARRPARKKARKDAPALPFLYLSPDDTQIEVGKNAAQNEKLTLGAKGDEFWCHAQKMPGSHVVIHSSAPSEETLEAACMLAAFYSKGASSANVPVDVTQRRYIKKPGGTPVGFVTYTHQATHYITPSEAAVRALRKTRG